MVPVRPSQANGGRTTGSARALQQAGLLPGLGGRIEDQRGDAELLLEEDRRADVLGRLGVDEQGQLAVEHATEDVEPRGLERRRLEHALGLGQGVVEALARDPFDAHAGRRAAVEDPPGALESGEVAGLGELPMTAETTNSSSIRRSASGPPVFTAAPRPPITLRAGGTINTVVTPLDSSRPKRTENGFQRP